MKDLKHECPNCKSVKIRLIANGTRDNENIDVLECTNCSLVYLSSQDHIYDNYYQDGKMLDGAKIEDWIKATQTDDKRRFKQLKSLIQNLVLIDFGAGNGGFLNLAKKSCKKVYGVELQKNVYEHFKKCGICVFSDIEEISDNADIITMFHVLEHIKNPVEVLKKIASRLNENGKIIIEVPNSNDALIKLYNLESFKKFTFWSCHLYIFNEKTLSEVVKKAGLKIQKINYIQRYTLMNHLYWIIKHKPAGHKIWAKYDFKILNSIYTTFLKAFKMTDTISIVITK